MARMIPMTFPNTNHSHASVNAVLTHSALAHSSSAKTIKTDSSKLDSSPQIKNSENEAINLDGLSSGVKAEYIVFQALKNLPDHYHIAYSVKVDRGEADFLIISDQLPLIILEVKNGHIEMTNNDVFQINRFTQESKKINPIEQLYNFHKLLLRVFEQNIKDLGYVFFDLPGLICFPSVKSFNFIKPDYKDRLILADDLLDTQKLDSIFKKRAEINSGKKINSQQVKKIVNYLASSSIGQEVNWTEHDAKALDQAYIRYLTPNLFNLKYNKNVALFGPAGSGKTILVTKAALMFSQKKLKVLITCYNDLIEKHLQDILKTHPDIEIKNFHNLAEAFCKKHNIALPQIASLSDEQKKNYYDQTLPELFYQCQEKLKEEDKFDVIIVDEAQDFKLGTWWLSLHNLYKNSKDSHFIVMLDPLQKLNDRDFLLKEIFPTSEEGFTRLQLIYNLRNTKRINKFAKTYFKKAHEENNIPFDEQLFVAPPDFPEGVNPTEIVVEKNEDYKIHLLNLLDKLIVEEKIPLQMITLLSTKSLQSLTKPPANETSYLHYHMSLDNYKFGPQAVETQAKDKTLQLETIFRFKGRENNVIILLQHSDIDSKRMYVTATRAISRLYILKT